MSLQRDLPAPRAEEPQQEQHRRSVGDDEAGGDAGEAEARDRPDAEPEGAAQHDLQRRSGEQRQRGHAHVARAAHDRGEGVEQPGEDRGRQRDARIGQGFVEHRTGAAEGAKDRRAEDQEEPAEEQPGRRPDHHRVERQRIGALDVAGAERAGDRRGDAAAHGPGREHLHQHDHGEHQRDGRQLRRAEDADIGRLADRHRGDHQHRRQVRQGQAQQRRQDRPLQQSVAASPRWQLPSGRAGREARGPAVRCHHSGSAPGARTWART